MEMTTYMRELGGGARAAARQLARASTAAKVEALHGIADELRSAASALIEENRKDLDAAHSSGLDAPLRERLGIDAAAVERMAAGVCEVAALPDPVGEITDLRYRPSGIQVGRMRVPLGVVGIIYESRPNVTADAAALCLKAGNACILRGGSEAIHSNRAIGDCIARGLARAHLPAAAAQLVQTTDRAAVGELLRLHEFVDVIVPRGGYGLIERVARESTIPVIKHLDGICHVYIDRSADVAMAVAVTVNSKVSKLAVCNAVETVLVDQDIAPTVLPPLVAALTEAGLTLRGCEQVQQLAASVELATEADWGQEYLGPILAIRVVADMDAAMEHINTWGSHHTDVIITSDYGCARRFLAEVDSASVMVNASSQFADGHEFGLGAEVGVSTDKLHARGPVGIEGLTTSKFVVFGSGEVRQR